MKTGYPKFKKCVATQIYVSYLTDIGVRHFDTPIVQCNHWERFHLRSL